MPRADASAWGMPFGSLVLPLIVMRPSIELALGSLRIAIGPVSLTLGFLFNSLMVALAATLAGFALLVDRRRQGHVLTIAVIWGPFFLAAALAADSSPVPVEAVQVLFNYLTYASVAFIALTYGAALGRQRLTIIVVLSGIVPVLYGLVQVALGSGGVRIRSTFSHPNVFAFFLLIYIAFLFHAQLSGYVRSAGLKALIWGILGVAMIALLFTGTRAAYISIFLFLFVYSAFRKPLLVLPILLLTPVVMQIPEVSQRITDAMSGSSPVSYEYFVSAMRGEVADSGTLDLDSGTWRRYLWQAAWP